MNLAFCFAIFLGLAAVTPGHAEEYYVYQTPNGALVISNKEPPPGSKIIKQLNLPEDPQLGAWGHIPPDFVVTPTICTAPLNVRTQIG